MYKIISDIGGTNDSAVVVPPSKAGQSSFFGIGPLPGAPCFSRCNHQEHFLRLSTSLFPQEGTFHFHQEFCFVAKK